MSDPSTLIIGVDFVCILARDFDAMTAFYGETLEDFGGTFSRNAMATAIHDHCTTATRPRTSPLRRSRCELVRASGPR